MVLRKHGLWQVIWGSSGRDRPCVEDPGKPLLALSTQRLQFIGSNWYSLLEKGGRWHVFLCGAWRWHSHRTKWGFEMVIEYIR